MAVETSTTRCLANIDRMCVNLRRHVHHVGLNLSVYDFSGREQTDVPQNPFCGLLFNCGLPCADGCRKLAARATIESQPVIGRASCGGCALSVPIYQRRRLVGTVVACFPTRQLLEEKTLAQLCNDHELDVQTLRDAGLKHVPHGQEQAKAFLHVLDWLVKNEQSSQNSSDELSALSANLSTTYEELSLIYDLSGSMSVTQQLRDYLRNACQGLREVMNTEAVAAVVSGHGRAGDGDFAIINGSLRLQEEEVKRLASTVMLPRFGNANASILDNNYSIHEADFADTIQNMVAAPLVLDGQVIGMLGGFNKITGDFDSTDLKLITSVGNQASIFLTNSILYADLQDLLMGVLHALTATIDAKDPYTSGHSQRVAMISKRLAEMCGLEAEKIQQIYLAGLLHDIGKIGVPEHVLRKNGRLTDEEFQAIKRHPAIGAKILGGIRQLDSVLEGIWTHHERLDGHGYPRGLKGDDIPFQGLIVGLADSFDAMTSDRTYRHALPLQAVIDEIRNHAGTQFDPILAQKLLSMDLMKFLDELRQPARTVLPVSSKGEQA